MSFSANLYADTSVSPESAHLRSPCACIKQFSREKSTCIFPVPSSRVAKQIFPKLRWSMTRPAIAIVLTGSVIIVSTVRNGEVCHSSIFAG